MHPYRRAPGDPLRDGLVGKSLALPARHRTQEREPVADLLAAVARGALDLGVRQSQERVDVPAGDVIEHPVIEVGIDSPGFRGADPVRHPARGDQCDPLLGGPGSDERTDVRADLVAAARGRQRRRAAIGVERRDGQVALRREEMQRYRQLVPALDLVGICPVDAAREAALEQFHAPGRSPAQRARRNPHQTRPAGARGVVARRESHAERRHVAVREILEVIVDEHHEEIGPRVGQSPLQLATSGVEGLALLGSRHLGPPGDEGSMRRECSSDDLSHGALRTRTVAQATVRVKMPRRVPDVWLACASLWPAVAYWPSADQELLLRAALSPAPTAREAWLALRPRFHLDAADRTTLKLLPLLSAGLSRHGIDDPLAEPLARIRAQTAEKNQTLFSAARRLLLTLADAGIDTMMLKGGAFAE